MDPAGKPSIICPQCQAENTADSEVCSSCGGSLTLVIDAPPEPPAPQNTTALRPRFRIGSLMIVIGGLAVCLGLLREVPGLFALFVILGVPALGRTYGGVSLWKARGVSMTWSDTLWMFAGSMAIVGLILLATVIAFAIICVPTGFLALSTNSVNFAFVTAVGAGLIAAGFAAFHAIKNLWPIREFDATSRPHVPGHDPEPLSGMPGPRSGEDHHEG